MLIESRGDAGGWGVGGGRFAQMGYPFLGRSSEIGYDRIWVGG